MRVALIGPVYPFRGGIAHYTTMLCRAFREQGHEVLMISFKRQYPQWLFPGKSDKDPSKEPLRVGDVHYLIDSLNPLTWLRAFLFVSDFEPDIIVLQWWTTFWAPVWFVFGVLNHFFLKRLLVYICHNVLPHEARIWDSWLARLTLRWGEQFIVQSKREKDHLLNLLKDASVHIAHHPVSAMFASQKISQVKARKLLGLPSNTRILLFFGIVRAYKGLKDLLRALPEVQNELGQVLLVIAGEFWEDKHSYEKIIEELNIKDSVVVEDRYIPNETVPLYFSAADVLVMPYRRVTGSGVVKMAVGFGLPVITTWLDREELALSHTVVSPGDVKGLAKAIVGLLSEIEGADSNIVTGPSTANGTWNDLAELIVERAP